MYAWQEAQEEAGVNEPGNILVNANPRNDMRAPGGTIDEVTLDHSRGQSGRSLCYVAGCEIIEGRMTNDPEWDGRRGFEVTLKVPGFRENLTYFFMGSAEECGRALGVDIPKGGNSVAKFMDIPEEEAGVIEFSGKYTNLYVSTDRDMSEKKPPLKTYGANPVVEGFRVR
jgi:hypothetical protein|tara:strand:- start:50 stop:559 length:510 start_codon:yes stop_codon:yes gene_type:complete